MIHVHALLTTCCIGQKACTELPNSDKREQDCLIKSHPGPQQLTAGLKRSLLRMHEGVSTNAAATVSSTTGVLYTTAQTGLHASLTECTQPRQQQQVHTYTLCRSLTTHIAAGSHIHTVELASPWLQTAARTCCKSMRMHTTMLRCLQCLFHP